MSGCGAVARAGWKPDFPTPGVLFLEDPEDELHLLVCLWLRARGRSTDGPELQREQEVFRDIKVSRELGTRTH